MCPPKPKEFDPRRAVPNSAAADRAGPRRCRWRRRGHRGCGWAGRAVAQGEDRGDRLDGAGGTEQVAGDPLVAETMTESMALPSARRIASASATSPCGVEVAWALMWTMSRGARPASRSAMARRSSSAGAGRLRGDDVVRVGRHAGTGQHAVDLRAARLRVLPVSSTRMPAPSPMTKPSRALSYGREAAPGSSLRVDSARMDANAAIGSGWMHRLRTAGHDHVGAARPDHVERERERFRA